MKKLIFILCVTIAIACIFYIAENAYATLNVSGLVVQDSDTGLEWLVMSETVNKSADRIIAGDYGLKTSGWVHATTSQVSTLFLNAGMREPFNGSGSTDSPWNLDAANHLIALLGYTSVSRSPGLGNYYGIQAFSGSTGGSPGNLYAPSILVGYIGIGSATVPGQSIPSSTASAGIGNWLVRANPAIKSPTFSSKSSTLTNSYIPMKAGNRFTYKSYGYPITIYTYAEAVSNQTIDQVNCLKIKYTDSYSSTASVYYWLAQDLTGNIWVLQYHDVEANDLRYYGINYAKIFMPSAVYIGSALWNPDGIERVEAINVTVPMLSTNLGPYNSCIKSKIINYVNTEEDIDYQYYAPNLGLVKAEFNDDGGTNGMDINAYFTKPQTAPWLPMLLDD